jgi:hypothetical protein
MDNFDLKNAALSTPVPRISVRDTSRLSAVQATLRSFTDAVMKSPVAHGDETIGASNSLSQLGSQRRDVPRAEGALNARELLSTFKELYGFGELDSGFICRECDAGFGDLAGILVHLRDSQHARQAQIPVGAAKPWPTGGNGNQVTMLDEKEVLGKSVSPDHDTFQMLAKFDAGVAVSSSEKSVQQLAIAAREKVAPAIALGEAVETMRKNVRAVLENAIRTAKEESAEPPSGFSSFGPFSVRCDSCLREVASGNTDSPKARKAMRAHARTCTARKQQEAAFATYQPCGAGMP